MVGGTREGLIAEARVPYCQALSCGLWTPSHRVFPHFRWVPTCSTFPWAPILSRGGASGKSGPLRVVPPRKRGTL